ncbi:hypothetical protein FHY55_04815 [Oceanicola sp. D3]|uniref:hypothetical protein n=1 Tax=Oceanicola sp. D3 TaxID=2587163 RepID=UPI001120CF45|nr:hypothetical protein [Oceanicola sp. D3]QDC08603.1 hypothetical protein FHY55_04815 [Oceanicola sp. D3]
MHRMVELIQSGLAERPDLKRIGRLFSETVLLKIDAEEYYLVFDKGTLAQVVPGPSKKIPYQVGLITDAEAMGRFWQALPQPGFHDLFGLVKIGRAEIVGDILVLVKNLRFLKEVLALPRGQMESTA